MQCCNSAHIHVSIIKDINIEQHRERNKRVDDAQGRLLHTLLGLTTEKGRLGIDLASLIASLCAWNILTLFMLDCQYFT